MLTTSISLDTPAGLPAHADPAATGTAGPAGAPGFASRLGELMEGPPGAGQNLAAAGIPLRTLALGPALEVLTAASEPVDADSLAEFAKAQGLDEEVVAWLFADPAQAGPIQPLTPPALAAGMVPPGGAGTGMPGSAFLTGTLSPGLEPGLPRDLPPAPLTAMVAAGTPVAAGALPAGQPIAGASAAAWLAGPMAAAALGAQAAAGSQATPSTLDAAQAAAADSAVPDTARMQSFALTQALAAGRAGAANTQFAIAGQASTATAPALPEEVLELDIEPGLDALWDGPASLTGEAPAGTGTDTAGTPLNSGSRQPGDSSAQAAESRSTSAQRAEGYQALAQRLGEAVAQRVLSQMEKGNWQVKLMLRPERLGEVEVDLKMRAGELDAAFRAANPVTRDLLNDGLPRLREVLAGAGMDIADLNVGSGLSQQAGGNPTPRPGLQADAAREPDTRPGAADAGPAAPVRRMGGAQGWDVTV